MPQTGPDEARPAPHSHPHAVRVAGRRQVFATNPAHAVRGLKYAIKRGKTPVLGSIRLS
jgi:hypothetical protein